jgi:hypothetical protein
MKLRLGMVAAALTIGLAITAAPALAKKKTFTVCKHGCEFRTIHAAVKDVKKGKRSVIKVKPGTYREGVQVIGHRYDGLSIVGTSKNPKKVVLQGKNAHIGGKHAEIAQNGIEGLNVNRLKIENMWAKNYAANGFFIHADPGKTCHGFLMKNDLASFNRSYGLFAKHCIGGRITKSQGWGHGDSAIYIGETPPQKHPKWTQIDHDKAFENVLGYSGTNSKYVNIHDSEFFNNGAGVVPNTLDSELFEPNANGKIHDNKIFWNNFNYYLPNSPVKTVSGGLGTLPPPYPPLEVNYPTGVGVALYGSDGWVVKDNKIFGNFMWGVASFSDPFNDKALNENNHITDNTMGRGGTDTNQFDFFNDGSGSGNCWSGNTSTTFAVSSSAHHPQAFLYPDCPAPDPPTAGTGDNQGDGASTLDGQVGDLAALTVSTPPCTQQDKWAVHIHPAFQGIKPIDTKDFGACDH